MIDTISAHDAEQLYYELKWAMKDAPEEKTRAGLVKALPNPAFITLFDPTRRVVIDATRDANPFFHVMETVWMFAGRNDVHWLTPYNKRMIEFAESSGFINGSYGFRWRYHWMVDQLPRVVEMLRTDPETRRAVIAMWDPDSDLQNRKDQPCNTHIYFRVKEDSLDATVCNRSNDLVWGLCGANIVHLTYLHEFVARAAGLRPGRYQVFTNNLHVYKHHWHHFERLGYEHYPGEPFKLTFTDYRKFLDECELFCAAPQAEYKDQWIRKVVQPMWRAHLAHKIGDAVGALDACKEIEAEDWRVACQRWLVRRFPFLGTQVQSNGTTPNESLNPTQSPTIAPTSPSSVQS